MKGFKLRATTNARPRLDDILWGLDKKENFSEAGVAQPAEHKCNGNDSFHVFRNNALVSICGCSLYMTPEARIY